MLLSGAWTLGCNKAFSLRKADVRRPCAGRDCSGGCECFPEKGARVSTSILLHKFQGDITCISLLQLNNKECFAE
uniref:Uncharacterized protein n=1 Tax=Varanus komodoensis TaxID=61221 RepID=A0A8D2IX18_VARKO